MFFFIISCGPKFYYKSDYSFYDEYFIVDKNSLLRTDGFYILESKWYKRNDSIVKPDKKEIYKFYKTGQANLLLLDSLHNNQKYLDLMQHQIEEYGKGKNEYTLFQGYYKLQNEKIVIQQVNIATKNFNYLYGFVENNKLIIVKSSIDGKGRFTDENFSEIYKATYVFVPFEKSEKDLIPNW